MLVSYFKRLSLLCLILLGGCDLTTNDDSLNSYSSISEGSTSTKVSPSQPITSSHALQSSRCDSQGSLETYQRYIQPLLAEGRNSSCSECHLGGSVLQSLVYDTPCETIYCWQQAGIIDLQTPEDSLLLSWIQRANGQVPEHIVAAENQGFLEWISYYANCNLQELCPNPAQYSCLRNTHVNESELPNQEYDHQQKVNINLTLPDAHYANERILMEMNWGINPQESSHFEVIDDLCDMEQTRYFFWKTFVKPWHSRCKHCHVEGELLASIGDPPHWLSEDQTLEGANESLDRILEAGYLDVENPEDSLLVLKPLSEYLGGVRHGGGPKFTKADDPTLRDLRAWIQHWASCESIYQSRMEE